MPPRVLASGPKPCGGNYAGVSIMPPRAEAKTLRGQLLVKGYDSTF